MEKRLLVVKEGKGRGRYRCCYVSTTSGILAVMIYK